MIVCDIAASLRHAATTQDYRDYMCEKHQWTPQDCKNVNWVALKYALRRVTNSNKPKIQKFIHDWLPLCGHKGTNQPPDQQHCPLCQGAKEMLWHFLECQHPQHTQLFHQLQCQLSQLHTNAWIDPHMFQLLWQGLNSICSQQSIEDQVAMYPVMFQTMFHH